MKRILSISLAVLLMLFTFCACTDNSGSPSSQNTFDDALTGTWYGPFNNPVLEIMNNGTGKVTYDETEYTAVFSAADNVFTTECDGFFLCGKYTVDDNSLTVFAEFGDKIYTIVFTRNEVVLPEALIGNHIYKIEDEVYEIVVEDKKVICKGIPYPPSAEYEVEEVYITPGFPHQSDTSEGDNIPENSGYIIHKNPPTDIFKPKSTETTSTPSINNTSAQITDSEDNTKPSSDNKEKEPEKTKDFVPEKINIEDDKVIVEQNGEIQTTTKGGGSIVGTWTSQKQEGFAYIFGYTTDFPYTVTYTFNADGTGTVTALLFTGTLTWSLNGNKLDITVSMLGDVDSGTAYVTLLGDTLYLENLDGDIYPMAKTG